MRDGTSWAIVSSMMATKGDCQKDLLSLSNGDSEG